MIIDEPDLMDNERLALAADALERGEAPIVYLREGGSHFNSRFYWLCAILRERGHADSDAEILACGASLRVESDH